MLGFTSLVSVHVITRDSVPLAADASGYYRTTLVLHRLLDEGRLREAWRHLGSTNLRPPLPQLVTVALYGLAGAPSQRLARLSMLVFFWLLLISTYGLGARLKDRPTGLAAATLLTCFPQVIGFSRSYWMDLPLAAMVTLNLWALLSTEGLRRRGRSLLYGMTLGLGLLTKYAFPIFAIGPTLYLIAVENRPGRRGGRVQLENLSLALLVATALAAFWYVPSLESAWRNFLFNQGGEVLPPRAAWTLDNLLLYPRELLTTQLGLPLGLAFVALLPLLRHTPPRPRTLLLLWLAIPYLVFTFLVLGLAWSRFTLPCLPAVALVMALGLMQFRLHPARRAACTALCLAALAGYVVLSFHPLHPYRLAWQRMQGRGLVAAESMHFHLPIQRLFSLERRSVCRTEPGEGIGITGKERRGRILVVRNRGATQPVISRASLATGGKPFAALGGARSTQVAVAPDAGCLASVLTTWAMEQRVKVEFSIPYEPEGTSFHGRFRFPSRVGDPRYLSRFDYVVLVQTPPAMPAHLRRPADYRRFLQAWRSIRHHFSLVDEVNISGGLRLLVHRNRGATGG